MLASAALTVTSFSLSLLLAWVIKLTYFSITQTSLVANNNDLHSHAHYQGQTHLSTRDKLVSLCRQYYLE